MLGPFRSFSCVNLNALKCIRARKPVLARSTSRVFLKVKELVAKTLQQSANAKRRTGRTYKGIVLYGPRTMKEADIPEMAVRPDQVRIKVHYCGLTGCDRMAWSGEYEIPAEGCRILGFEVTGTILETGRVAHSEAGYHVGEEVVAFCSPPCGGFAETCLVSYTNVFRLKNRISQEDAATMVNDYFSSFIALGRRAQIQRGEYFLINTLGSRMALAAIDLGLRVFGAKPIVMCNHPMREKVCLKMGAVAVVQNDVAELQKKLQELTGNSTIRVIIDTEGGETYEQIVECMRYEGIMILLSCVREHSYDECTVTASNNTVCAVAVPFYVTADPLVYRETVEHLINFRKDNIIQPKLSAIFGSNKIHDAFLYYEGNPNGKILIDFHNRDRCDKE